VKEAQESRKKGPLFCRRTRTNNGNVFNQVSGSAEKNDTVKSEELLIEEQERPPPRQPKENIKKIPLFVKAKVIF
jgi:hypothetical protein